MNLLNALSTLNRALCSRFSNAYWVSKAFGVLLPPFFLSIFCASRPSPVSLCIFPTGSATALLCLSLSLTTMGLVGLAFFFLASFLQ